MKTTTQQRLATFLLVAWSLLLWVDNSGSSKSILMVVVGATSLEGGGGAAITTSTNVDVYADLSLDVQSIQSSSSSSSSAMNIYLNGQHAIWPSSSTTNAGEKLSLQALSESLATMNPLQAGGPNYLYHLYGLSSRSTDVTQQAHYANNYVQSLLSKEDNNNLASTAMMVLNVWMYGTFLLYRGVDTCQKRLTADNPDLFPMEGGGGMDEFVALWIGRNLTIGNARSVSHSLYGWTNEAADLFTIANIQEASVNTNIKTLYQQGVEILTNTNSCVKSTTTGSSNNEDSTSAAQQLWTVTQQIISQMTVPLVQMLIDSLMQFKVEETQLYAMALIPQLASCRPSIFKRLHDELLLSSNTINFDKTQDIIADLQQVYPCLGIRCEDVGAYLINRVPQCNDPSANVAMAEYTPSTNTHPLAWIDLDILQLKILTSLGAYDAAKYLYLFGRNAPNPTTTTTAKSANPSLVSFRSLQSFATVPARQNAGALYNAFVSYYNDPYYANTTITNIFNGMGKWGTAPADVKAAIVGTTASFQITYMYVWSELQDALHDCLSKNELANEGNVNSWDQVAALTIGSLEGPNAGGSMDPDDGQLFWNLANQRAFQFQTIADGLGYSQAASTMEDLLFAGKGMLDALDCINLAKTVNQINMLVLIPIIQSAIRYAIQNSGKTASLEDTGFAYGEAFALAVLPILAQYDKSAAQVIAENMVVQVGETMVQSGVQQVANAFAAVAVSNLNLECSDLGQTSQVNPCLKYGQSGSSSVRYAATSTSNQSFLFGTIASLIAWLLL